MEASQAIPVFLALVPDDSTAERIWQYKHRVRELVGDQLYLDHPPHLTCFLACFKEVSMVIEATRRVVNNISTPTIALNGWHTFFADPLTGLHTLVLNFGASDRDRLRQIQTQCVETLGPCRDGAASLDRINGRWSQLSLAERSAAQKYGFPYIGTGWHPHFTVASIRPDDWPAVERELLRETPQGMLTCPRLQVFRLVDNVPVLVETFDLPPSPKTHSMVPSQEQHPSSDNCSLKRELTAAMWSVVDRHEWILSATLTGSFLTDQTLSAISDIDLVVIVEELNGERFDSLQAEFTRALTPVLSARNLKLRINPTLGPRKLNDDATAVLHLMLYSREAHHEHVINSPFTCLDWQRSVVNRKRSMADIYPVFGLQPHHFVSARRGLRDYLKDFEQGVVSYREIECSDRGCTEVRREEPMSERDRYEYAYHAMRFLMQNLLKLVRRTNRVSDGSALTEDFAKVFPEGIADYADLYRELRWRKARRDFSSPIPRLSERLNSFVIEFESQFRRVFSDTATRHLFFRHAPTHRNRGEGDERRFLGRSDPEIELVSDEQLGALIAAAIDFPANAVYTSPLRRCRESLDLLGHHFALPAVSEDRRLLEINYGTCEGLTVAEARQQHPDLFAAWKLGKDPQFPAGENLAEVDFRLRQFLAREDVAATNSIICTHNVVLRCLVGEGMGVPRSQWHLINVPHLAPISIVRTREYGWFVDLEESVERQLFGNFLYPAQGAR